LCAERPGGRPRYTGWCTGGKRRPRGPHEGQGRQGLKGSHIQGQKEGQRQGQGQGHEQEQRQGEAGAGAGAGAAAGAGAGAPLRRAAGDQVPSRSTDVASRSSALSTTWRPRHNPGPARGPGARAGGWGAGGGEGTCGEGGAAGGVSEGGASPEPWVGAGSHEWVGSKEWSRPPSERKCVYSCHLPALLLLGVAAANRWCATSRGSWGPAGRPRCTPGRRRGAAGGGSGSGSGFTLGGPPPAHVSGGSQAQAAPMGAAPAPAFTFGLRQPQQGLPLPFTFGNAQPPSSSTPASTLGSSLLHPAAPLASLLAQYLQLPLAAPLLVPLAAPLAAPLAVALRSLSAAHLPLQAVPLPSPWGLPRLHRPPPGLHFWKCRHCRGVPYSLRFWEC